MVRDRATHPSQLLPLEGHTKSIEHILAPPSIPYLAHTVGAFPPQVGRVTPRAIKKEGFVRALVWMEGYLQSDDFQRVITPPVD